MEASAGPEVIDVDDTQWQDVMKATKTTTSEARNIFTQLRKAANHPLLLRYKFDDAEVMLRVAKKLTACGHFGKSATLEMVEKEIATYSDYDLHQVCCTYPSLSDLCLDQDTLFSSAKMAALRELLPRLRAEGHRALIFSQWTRVLDIMEVFLSDVLGFEFCRLDGSTPVAERTALIDRFQRASVEEIPVFLLSTRAGGLGINLTCADTVILHDLDFNPENDRQAEDRCHRIGQKKPVTVYRLVVRDTVDEGIYRMGERKKVVNRAVLGDAGGGAATQKKEDQVAISSILSRAIRTYAQAHA